FGPFLASHPEIFTSLPDWAGAAAREMITVDGVPKKEKQKALWKALRSRIPLRRLLRILWDAWRSVR
ncbi:MAG TPA: FAD-dependent oxidoreductase, partial [Thermodesulfobacteriota bacterium]|nr:FAD-dependent oxidoreductase [Thermodesulfobacteriota bacterium]